MMLKVIITDIAAAAIAFIMALSNGLLLAEAISATAIWRVFPLLYFSGLCLWFFMEIPHDIRMRDELLFRIRLIEYLQEWEKRPGVGQ